MAMRFEHEFTVPVPVEQAWPVLLDVERVAPCLPGATVDKVEGDAFTGKLKVKVGPITVTYQGRASFEKVNEEARSMTLVASGKEARGSGTAGATVVARLHPEGRTTRVTVETSFTVTGRPAQFGRGVMTEVGGKLIDRFAANLSRLLGESPGVEITAETAPQTGGVGGWSAPTTPDPASAAQADTTPSAPEGPEDPAGPAAEPTEPASATEPTSPVRNAKNPKSSKRSKDATPSESSKPPTTSETPETPQTPATPETPAPGPAGATAPGDIPVIGSVPAGATAPGAPGDTSGDILAGSVPAGATGSGHDDPSTGFPGPAGATAPAAEGTGDPGGADGAGATPPASHDADSAASGLGGPDGPEGMNTPTGAPAPGPAGTARHLSAVPTPPDLDLGEDSGTRRNHPAGTSRTSLSPDEEALNLLEVAGLPLLKRVAPVVAALAALILVAWLVRRALNRR